jgi:hypothetical protein
MCKTNRPRRDMLYAGMPKDHDIIEQELLEQIEEDCRLNGCVWLPPCANVESCALLWHPDSDDK